MSDKIEGRDLLNEDSIKQVIQDVTGHFIGLENQLKKNLEVGKAFGSSIKIKNLNDIKSFNEAVAKQEKLLRDLEKASAAVAQGSREMEKLEQERLKTLQQNEKLTREEIKTEQLLQKTKEKTLTLYQQESKLLRDLKNEYYNVALAQGQDSKAAQDLLAKLTPLDQKLKAINKTAGDNFRTVGDYERALKGAGGAINNILAAGGITLGLGAAVNQFTDAIKKSREFEVALADLQAITDVSKDELVFFSENAKKLGVNVQGGAKAVVEAYKLIGSAKPELLKNKEALNEVTKAAITLSQASGLTLPDSATRLTDVMSQLKIPVSQVGKLIDVLANASQFGAAEVPQLSESLVKFGGISRSFNVNIQQSAALVETLAENGIKGSEAGTQLRNVLLNLQNAKGLDAKAIKSFKEAGVNIDLVSDKSAKFDDRLKEASKLLNVESGLLNVFGKENIIAAQNVLENTTRITELTGLLDKNGTAAAQAKINTSTFSQSLLVLENNVDNLKISLGDSSGGFFKIFTDSLNEALLAVNDAQSKFNDLQKTLAKQGVETTFLSQFNHEQNILNLGLNEAVNKLQLGADASKKYADAILILQASQNSLKNSFDKGSITNQQYIEESAILRQGIIDLTSSSKDYTKQLGDEKKATDNNTESTIKNTSAKFDAEKEAEKNFQKFKAQREKEKAIEDENNVNIEANATKISRTKEEIEAERVAYELNISALEYEQKKKNEEELAALKKKNREDEIKDLADTVGKALDLAQKRINDEEKLREDALDKEISDREKNIDVQRERALNGLDNTLALEESKLAQAQRKKEDEAKKAIKREETLAFFKLLASNAEKDPNTALQKSLTEILLGRAIAGSFYVGTEKVEDSLKGNKVHNGKDGYHIAVDGKERILTGEQNEKIGGLTNKELADLAYNFNSGKLLPDYSLQSVIPVKSFAENVYASKQLDALLSVDKRLQSLEQTINNKPVSSLHIDDKFLTRSDTANGFTNTTKKPLTRGWKS